MTIIEAIKATVLSGTKVRRETWPKDRHVFKSTGQLGWYLSDVQGSVNALYIPTVEDITSVDWMVREEEKPKTTGERIADWCVQGGDIDVVTMGQRIDEELDKKEGQINELKASANELNNAIIKHRRHNENQRNMIEERTAEIERLKDEREALEISFVEVEGEAKEELDEKAAEIEDLKKKITGLDVLVHWNVDKAASACKAACEKNEEIERLKAVIDTWKERYYNQHSLLRTTENSAVKEIDRLKGMNDRQAKTIERVDRQLAEIRAAERERNVVQLERNGFPETAAFLRNLGPAPAPTADPKPGEPEFEAETDKLNEVTRSEIRAMVQRWDAEDESPAPTPAVADPPKTGRTDWGGPQSEPIAKAMSVPASMMESKEKNLSAAKLTAPAPIAELEDWRQYEGDWNIVEDPRERGCWRIKGKKVRVVDVTGALVLSVYTYDQAVAEITAGRWVRNRWPIPGEVLADWINDAIDAALAEQTKEKERLIQLLKDAQKVICCSVCQIEHCDLCRDITTTTKEG